jgi:hypothetical protein
MTSIRERANPLGILAGTMHLELETDFRDFAAAQTLHAKRTELNYASHCVARFFYPAVGVLILLFEFIPRPLTGSSHPQFLGVACGLILTCIPFYIRAEWKRTYKRSRSENGSCALDFTEEMIRCTGVHSKSEIQWSAIKSFSEDEKLFLLYLAPGRFLPIPKRICTPQQIEELRALFQQRVQPSLPSVVLGTWHNASDTKHSTSG